MADTRFSIVIPVYNEEENIPELYRRLTLVMEGLCKAEGFSKDDYEVIMADDGSNDRSWHLIKELHEKDPRINGISFSRNFGHHIAISAGIDHASGENVVLMDGDLQDPPEEIPKLHQKLKEGYDLVYGIREKRADKFHRRMISYFFWIIFKAVIGFDIHKNQTMLRIMSKKYIDNFKKLRERNRVLAGLFAWTGFAQTAVRVTHAQRFAGKSKYNLWRMIKLTFNAITSFSFVPLQLAGIVGSIISVLSFLYATVLIVRRVVHDIDIPGWASLMVAILFIGGVQLASLGLIGEYIGRIFTEVQGRPLYMIKEKAGDLD
jgi:polyisoprenyl-phosphate glycosyltransferase